MAMMFIPPTKQGGRERWQLRRRPVVGRQYWRQLVAAANGGRRQRVVAETSPKQGKNRGEESRAARGEEGQAPATLAETAASRWPTWVATEGRVSAAGDRRRREEAEKEEAGEGFHGARAEKAKEPEESLI